MIIVVFTRRHVACKIFRHIQIFTRIFFTFVCCLRHFFRRLVLGLMHCLEGEGGGGVIIVVLTRRQVVCMNFRHTQNLTRITFK